MQRTCTYATYKIYKRKNTRHTEDVTPLFTPYFLFVFPLKKCIATARSLLGVISLDRKRRGNSSKKKKKRNNNNLTTTASATIVTQSVANCILNRHGNI